jgi:threonine dehydrogenase-like Zn-dependent dehydrogenase
MMQYDHIPIPTPLTPHMAFSACRCQAGRLYLERVMSLISYGRLHPEHLATHVLHGFDSIPEAFAIMSDKTTPGLIKSISIY